MGVVLPPPDNEGFRIGDEVRIDGSLEAPRSAGEGFALFPKKITRIAAAGFSLSGILADFKGAILKKMQEFSPGDAGALLGGETLGGSDGISAGLKNEMSVSGTSYIVSMYGYKIAMIVFMLEAVLRGWLSRRWRFLAIIGVIILFVAMSGGNFSAIRAAVMAVAALAAKLAGRIADPRRALVLTAAGMAAFDPALTAQAPFALSFLSVAGLFYLARPFEHFFGWNVDGDMDTDGSDAAATRHRLAGMLRRARSVFRESVIFAVASLLPIVPIIAAGPGGFSMIAFASNILISPSIVPAMLAGASLALFGFTVHPIAIAVAKLAGLLLLYQFVIIKLCSMIVLPLPAIFGVAGTFIAYYGILAGFVWRYG
jgi:ComEC/Rec2-related protein